MGIRALFRTKHILIILIGIFLLSSFVHANNPGEQNITVQTQLNVTDAPPKIEWVSLPAEVNLNPGLTKEVNCTANITEWNGPATIKLVNATLWDNNSVQMNDSDMNITHYTDDNCTEISSSAHSAEYVCTFNIQFYAYNSSDWICNVTALDNSTYNFTDWEYNTTTVNPLYAINVTPTIDFGDAATGDFISNKTANVTNFGNQPVNISVQGYGVSKDDGLALDCESNGGNGNITIDNLKFSSSPIPIKTDMDGTMQNMSNITILQINQSGIDPGYWQTTYWDLNVDPANNPFGWCTGTVIFTAWNFI